MRRQRKPQKDASQKKRKFALRLASKEELSEASMVEQIALIEQIAQEVIEKPKQNVNQRFNREGQAHTDSDPPGGDGEYHRLQFEHFDDI